MIKTLSVLFTVMAVACIVAGLAIFMGKLDAAFLIGVPGTFNQPCAVTLVFTGVAVLAAPFLQKHKK